MGILSWLENVTRLNNIEELSQPICFCEGEEEFKGLNMKAALDAHLSWTRHFEEIIKGHYHEQIQVDDIASDDRCVLGKWIHGDAKQLLSHVAEYHELKNIHAHFHITAGYVASNIEKGEINEAREQLKAVQCQSGRVQLALARLYLATNKNLIPCQ